MKTRSTKWCNSRIITYCLRIEMWMLKLAKRMNNNHTIQSWMSNILKVLRVMKKFRILSLGRGDRYAIKESLRQLKQKKNGNSLSTSHRSISMSITNQLTVSTRKIHKDLRMLLYHKSGSGINTIIWTVSKLPRQPQCATSPTKVTV